MIIVKRDAVGWSIFYWPLIITPIMAYFPYTTIIKLRYCIKSLIAPVFAWSCIFYLSSSPFWNTIKHVSLISVPFLAFHLISFSPWKNSVALFPCCYIISNRIEHFVMFVLPCFEMVSYGSRWRPRQTTIPVYGLISHRSHFITIVSFANESKLFY